MSTIMRLMWKANGEPLGDAAGKYIKTVDVQQAPHSDLWITHTPDIEEALRFPSYQDAWEKYQEVLLSEPVRHDGEPNRPLTAYFIEFIPYQSWDSDDSKAGIFRDHRCWKCDDGRLPCAQGGAYQCGYPRARND